MNKELVNIFNDTLRQTATTYKADTSKAKHNVRVYDINELPSYLPKSFTPIEMVEGGTASVSYLNCKDGDRVALLNFADALVPGGFPDYGAPTQEENLCRCSNLYPVLKTRYCYDNYYRYNNQPQFLEGTAKERWGIYSDRIIYAKDITFFKDDATYEAIPPKKMDVIVSPAPSIYFPSPEKAVEVYTRRILKFLVVAMENGVDTIVLGAWGCGAFGQEPNLIAQAFALALNVYGDGFKRIIFAIRPTAGCTRNATFDIFGNTLSAWYRGEVIR